MKRYTALLGSTALAMVLFSGCGDSESTSSTPSVQNETSTLDAATAKSSLRSTSNMLLRSQAKNSDVEMADVVMTLAL